MGIVIRQSARTLVISYIGFVIGYINVLILYPLAFSPEQIGLQSILINSATLFSAFACLGTPQISVRFFPYFRDKERGNNGFLFFLLMLGLTGFLLFVIVFLSLKNVFISVFAKNSPGLINYYYYLIPFTFIVLITIIFEAFSLAQLKPVVPRFIRDFLIRVLLSLGVLAVFFHLISFSFYIDLLPVIYAVGMILIAIYLKTLGQLHIRPNAGVIKSEYLKTIVAYSGFMLLANTSDIIIRNIDSLMLSAYAGLRSNGIYSIALNIALVIEIPRRSMSQVIAPLVAEATKKNDILKIEELYKKSSINQLIIGGLIFLVIWCNLESIFKVIPNGNTYILGKWVVFFFGIGKMFDLATGINAEIIGYSKYYKYDLFLYAVLSILAIGLNMVMIPKFGMTGAGIASALSIISINSTRYLFILYKLRIQPFTFNTIKVAAAAAVVLILNYLMPHIPNHFLLDTAVRSLIIALVFTGITLWLKASEDINQTIIKVINRYRP
ncbi:MAG: lipopolysaccharide biosynthesis protein [Bacillota bacterium]